MENTITPTLTLAEITAAIVELNQKDLEKVKYAVRKELKRRANTKNNLVVSIT